MGKRSRKTSILISSLAVTTTLTGLTAAISSCGGKLVNNPAVAYAYLVGNDNGAVSHWALDEQTGTTAEDTTSGFNGTYYAGPGTPTFQLGLAGPLFGWTNYSTLFHSAGIVVPYQARMKRNRNLSIEAWMKIATSQTVAWAKVMWMGPNGSYCAGQGPWGYEIFNNTNNLLFHVALDTAGDGKPRDLKSKIMTTVIDNQWHHVVGVLDADGATNDQVVKVYVDGQQAPLEFYDYTPVSGAGAQLTGGTELVGGIIPDTAYLLKTGSFTSWASNTCADAEATPSKGLVFAASHNNSAPTNPPTLQQYFDGNFSHMAFYEASLSPGEVLNHYKQGICGNPTCH